MIDRKITCDSFVIYLAVLFFEGENIFRNCLCDNKNILVFFMSFCQQNRARTLC